MRNGSVIDLQIEAGRVRALVSGTDLYTVDIKIKPLAKKKWTEIKGQCAGQIDSLVELLQGSISKGVMEIVTRKGEGLFPSPREISLSCSCPDWATMCKHVAATLYGVGARLDHEPELLFTLRGVDPTEMVEAAIDQPTGAGRQVAKRPGARIRRAVVGLRRRHRYGWSVIGRTCNLDGAVQENAARGEDPEIDSVQGDKEEERIQVGDKEVCNSQEDRGQEEKHGQEDRGRQEGWREEHIQEEAVSEEGD